MRYPLSRLPKAIGMILDYELRIRRRQKTPTCLTVKAANTYAYYMKGEIDKVGFIVEVDLVLKKGSVNPNLIDRLQCSQNHQVANYLINWGSWNGDLSSRSGLVNSDKSERVLNRNQSVIRCYLERQSNNVIGDVLFHPDDVPSSIPQIELNDRERSLMFVFAKLSGTEQAIALTRLNTSQEEISILLKKKAIKESRGGHAITISGLAAQSDNPTLDRW